jgi:hypothetical protein
LMRPVETSGGYDARREKERSVANGGRGAVIGNSSWAGDSLSAAGEAADGRMTSSCYGKRGGGALGRGRQGTRE